MEQQLSPLNRRSLWNKRRSVGVVLAAVVWAVCYRAYVPDSFEEVPSKLAVVIPFSFGGGLDQLEVDLASWNKNPPCRPWAPKLAALYFYPLLPSEDEPTVKLEELVRPVPQRFRACFSYIGILEHANTTTLSPNSSLTSALSAANFYQLLFTSFPVSTSHILILFPNTHPSRKYWASKLSRLVIHSEPFWIRGSTTTSNSSHMDRNAIYAVHDKQFKSFLEKVISGRFAEIPFEKAWYEYLYSPGREAFRRERLVKFVFSRLVKAQKDASINGLPLKESSTSLFAVGAYKEIETEEKTISSALDPVLTVLLATHAIDGKTINLAFSTSKYYELLLNYVHFVKKAKMNYLIISMDQETTQLCLYHNIPHYAFHNENEFLEESDDYTSLAFRNVINKRNRLLSNLLRAGYNILQADLDVIFFKNPFPFFFNGDYEYEVQSDDRQRLLESSSSSDTRQPSFDEFVNSGIFYAKGTSRMADFYNILMDTVSEYPTQPEQFLLNTVLQYNELRIKYRIMDPSLFPNGFQYFVLGISQRAGVDPFCLHGDWIGGKEVKKYRLREAGAWSQDSIGYTDKVNGRYLVAFDPTVENNGWNNVRNSIRAGMAIASILGRTLVLPAMYAHHNRSTPVSLDYYLDYNVFSRNFPNFRESTFARRIFPERPHSVNHIAIYPGNPPSYQKPTTTEIFRTKGFHRGATDVEILEWLGPKADEPIVYLSGLFRRFHKFEDPKQNAKFDAMISNALGPSSSMRDISGIIINVLAQDAHAVEAQSTYNCAHIRRGDFIDIHKEQPMEEIVKILSSKMNTKEVLYVSSDDSSSLEFRQVILSSFPRARFMPEFLEMFPEVFSPYNDKVEGYSMFIGAVEQRVCAGGKAFVGNIYSTFTTHICYLRQGMGISGAALCPDVYDRPYSSDWDYF